MKKLVAPSMILVAFLVASCASGPAVEKPEMSKEARPQVIDDQYHGSRETPQWVFLEASEIEDSDILGADKGKVYVFKVWQTGKNLDGVQLWAQKFNLASDIADTVSTRVQSKFVGAAAGDRNALENYLEAVVKTTSEAQYSGARTKSSYWWQIRRVNPDGSIEQVYEYFLMVTIPKDVLDKQIKMALDEAAANVKPKNEEEKTARVRVQEAFDKEGL